MNTGKTILCCSAALLIAASAIPSLSQEVELTPKEELGKAIFFDPNLSINQNQACAACHGPEAGWTGPEAATNAGGAVYEGSIPGRFGNRKPPSAAYATTSPIFYLQEHPSLNFVGGNFWDGRATGYKLGNPAADQAQFPFLNPLEQGLPDSACVVYQVCHAAYPVSYSFTDVWGAEVCDIAWPVDTATQCSSEGTTVGLSDADRAKSNMAYDYIALSIAAYEGSPEVNAFSSKYDYSFKGMAKLSIEERRGFALFMGKGGCNRCHSAVGKDALFTDYTYDNLGIPKNTANPFYAAHPDFIDYGLGGYLESLGYPEEVYEPEMGKQKVPTLRNVDKRPEPGFVKAYGHNGYFKSLEEIVHFYNTRDVLPTCSDVAVPQEGVNCWPEPEVPENVNTDELGDLGLSEAEEADIVAFLKTLSDDFTE
ncbi:MAG: cytochrome c peroxidase [Deltaproteobacteria bacterium]